MRVLIFSAHPDDETLGAGGTILKHKASGSDVYWCVFTTALKDSNDEYKRYRKRLVARVANEYGFSDVFDLGYPATELDRIGFKDLVDDTINVIKKVKTTDHIHRWILRCEHRS
jgi:LmbE family N-acetylglucosaminyl deacetylase